MPPPNVTVPLGEFVAFGADELRIVATCAILTAVALGVILWWVLGRVDRCTHCSHCQSEMHAEWRRNNGVVDSTERERLFGRRVSSGEDEAEISPDEGPSGDGERDEGRSDSER